MSQSQLCPHLAGMDRGRLSVLNGREDDRWNLVQRCQTRQRQQLLILDPPCRRVLKAVIAIPVQPGSWSNADEADEDWPEEWCYRVRIDPPDLRRKLDVLRLESLSAVKLRLECQI